MEDKEKCDWCGELVDVASLTLLGDRELCKSCIEIVEKDLDSMRRADNEHP